MINSTNSMQVLIETFHKSELFRNFTNEEVQVLATSLSHLQQYYSKNALIYNENDICMHMDLVVKGSLIIQQIDEYGNVLSIIKFGQGQTIAGNILFSTKNVYPMSITAVSDVILLPLSKKLVLELCQDQRFMEALLINISNRAAILSHTIKNITRKSLRNKLIDYFIHLSSLQKSTTLVLPVTKTDLANSLGVARPSLSRELLAMKKDGLLNYEKKTIFLTKNFIQMMLGSKG